QASSRPAGCTPTADLGLELAGTEQTVAEAEPGPARRLHGATQVRWTGPTCHDPVLSRLATGDGSSCSSGRSIRTIEHEQRRTALPRAGGELPGVAGSYRGA